MDHSTSEVMSGDLTHSETIIPNVITNGVSIANDELELQHSEHSDADLSSTSTEIIESAGSNSEVVGGYASSSNSNNTTPRKRPRQGSVGDDEESTFDSYTSSFDGGDSSDAQSQNPAYNLFIQTRQKMKLRKQSGEEFIQDASCKLIDPRLNKCIECRRDKKSNPDAYCRFQYFRKLQYENFVLKQVGFLSPVKDAVQADRNLWLPVDQNFALGNKPNMGKSMCRALLDQVGDQFCFLIQQEFGAIRLNLNLRTREESIWKKLVPGVRDLCDVCATTIFNYHWLCHKCGFVACLTCYTSRRDNNKNDSIEDKENASEDALDGTTNEDEDKDFFKWPRCSRKERHEISELLLTQVIPEGVLNEINVKFHNVRNELNITQECGCDEAKKYDQNTTQITPEETPSAAVENDAFDCWDMLCSDSQDEIEKPETAEEASTSTEEINVEEKETITGLNYFVRPGGISKFHRQQLPVKTVSWVVSRKQYPGANHSWFCNGMLLNLEEPLGSNNIPIFQEVWRSGQPVMVSNVTNNLDSNLWSPIAFANDEKLRDKKIDLVNCISGMTVPKYSIKGFFEGFEQHHKRTIDQSGESMLLKLKDWPPEGEFENMMPERFRDLMRALPLIEYTGRKISREGFNRTEEDGIFNLADRLPDEFVKPDLGPKMYIAYGSGTHLEKGTTNLHLDVSDAINVMVYVGIPKDVDNTEHLKGVADAIKGSDCALHEIEKALSNIEQAGALWHIYRSCDADKIRDFLNKLKLEDNNPLEPDHDPIHDQTWYIDKRLRKRLMAEYGVSGFPIIQCYGEAIFIPAGAPHQVRNLNNCIKIAEDFVSPENVGHCFDLTEEFRRLSDNHQNHEDKLQIRNIVYHSVKDAISTLLQKD